MSAATPGPEMQVLTLDAAIEAVVASGVIEPLAVVDTLKKKNGVAWLKAAVAARAEEFARARARDYLGSARHRAERNARAEAKKSGTGKAATTTLTKDSTTWVPDDEGGTEIPTAQVTAADLRARALYYRNRASAFTAYAAWLYDVADAMDAAGASVLSDLDEVPAPPAGVEGDDLINGGV